MPLILTRSKAAHIKPALQKLINSLDPDCRERRMVERWILEFNIYQSRIERKRLVLESIKNGCWTLTDIEAETGISYYFLRPIINQLINQKKISEHSYKSPERRGASERIFKIIIN